MKLNKLFYLLKKIFFSKSYITSLLALIALGVFAFESLNSQGLLKAFNPISQDEQSFFTKLTQLAKDSIDPNKTMSYPNFSLFSKEKEQELFAKVIKVSDGDTIHIQDENKATYKIRMQGIDAPESKQSYGKESTNYLKNLILNKEVKALISEKDKYNRFVATIYLPQNQPTLLNQNQTNENHSFQNNPNTTYLDINKQMVRQGYAHAYRSFSTKYIEDEVYARKNKLGLWKQESHLIQNPAEFRKENK